MAVDECLRLSLSYQGVVMRAHLALAPFVVSVVLVALAQIAAAVPTPRPSSSAAPAVGMTGFHLDSAIKVGDLVATISVLVAVLVFLYSRRRDRMLRDQQSADKVGEAAAGTLSRMDRCLAISDSFFDRIQKSITETDEFIVRKRDLAKARYSFGRSAMKPGPR